MYEKLKELAERLQAENRHDDAALVFSAMMKFAPLPTPKFEKLSNPIPGYYLYMRAY